MSNIFVGHFDVVLEELLKLIPIDLVIVEDKPANKDVKKRCNAKGIDCFAIKSYEDMLGVVKDVKKIDLCVVASFGTILKEEFIDKCRYIVNFHPGDVDVCRGRHPLPAAILNRHKTMGATAHLIDSPQVDAGPILAKTILPIDYSKSYRYNEDRLTEAMRSLIRLLIGDYLANGRFVAYDWDVKASVYYRPLGKGILEKVLNSDELSWCLK